MKVYNFLFLSIARILATIGIFIFHIFGLLGIDNRGIDFVSILIFSFLSGYFYFGVQDQPLRWFYKKIFSILIPYWFIIVPVVFINRIVQYKATTVLMDFVTQAMFVQHQPVQTMNKIRMKPMLIVEEFAEQHAQMGKTVQLMEIV